MGSWISGLAAAILDDAWRLPGLLPAYLTGADVARGVGATTADAHPSIADLGLPRSVGSVELIVQRGAAPSQPFARNLSSLSTGVDAMARGVVVGCAVPPDPCVVEMAVTAVRDRHAPGSLELLEVQALILDHHRGARFEPSEMVGGRWVERLTPPQGHVTVLVCATATVAYVVTAPDDPTAAQLLARLPPS